MIYYYSAEGNSRHVALTLARMLGETATDIRNVRRLETIPDSLGLVFPVHCWGVPPAMRRFLESLPCGKEGSGVWAVMTCGDDTGLAHRMLGSLLRRRGHRLQSVYSVTMPNTYLLMKGFHLDSPEVVRAKLYESEQRCTVIAKAIRSGELVEDVHTGAFAWIKTRIIYPLFFRRRISPRRWRVDAGSCIGCGKCAAECPERNIKMDDGKPAWGNDCVQCLACYHNCPARAIDCLPYTGGKGQYVCPSE